MGKAKSGAAQEQILGTDDTGRFYSGHMELIEVQEANKDAWYSANEEWWTTGYGGSTDAAAMIGDELTAADEEESLRFLDSLLKKHPQVKTKDVVDAGAGVGRVSKNVLLRRFENAHLIEADSGWLKRARVYMGKKRASRCTFLCSRLEQLQPLAPESADLIWIQWALQYLTELDVVKSLKALKSGLRKHGLFVVKENRPYGSQRPDRFFMETPEGEEGRFDVTRPDAHHRVLFDMAGLEIVHWEEGEETHTYALRDTET